MSYQSMVAMAASQSLITRCAACAADEGMRDQPVTWVQQVIWRIVATEGWSEAWDYATASANRNVNPDTGMRDDVITDDMIRDAVRPMVDEVLVRERDDEGNLIDPTIPADPTA